MPTSDNFNYCYSHVLTEFSFPAGLILVPPPIWVILCSFRTVVTTFIYKFILKRDVTTLQFVGSFLIVLSIVVAKLGIKLINGRQLCNCPDPRRSAVQRRGQHHPRHGDCLRCRVFLQLSRSLRVSGAAVQGMQSVYCGGDGGVILLLELQKIHRFTQSQRRPPLLGPTSG